ncbi:MAG: 3-methyl-2-oxobutanoate hydroxymethyltransferase [Chloroflexia bacterium]|nr:3-methyl-2-oxobutanoate hydroxymethyltransferase [Chloroflexia bacterium]
MTAAAGEQPGPKPKPRRKLTVPGVRAHKGATPLVMVALYDFSTARLAEAAGVDMILVGDSLGMVLLGHASTVPVTLDDIVRHTQAVVRGAPKTHVVADLPFLTYHIDDGRTVENAGRLIQEGGADAVKLEGGRVVARRVRALTDAGIPVCGHVGLTPQSAGALGGFKVQGATEAGARHVLADAEAVAEAGAYALVLEAIPAELGALVTERVDLPTIGIGAGPDCDGQVLLAHDLLGLEERFAPRFVKRYADLAGITRSAFAAYAEEVRQRTFPAPEHTYAAEPEVVRSAVRTPGE